MRKYPEYKPSGVDWLGEIPSDWSLEKVKFHLSFSKGTNPKELIDENKGELPEYISVENLRGKQKNIQYVKDWKTCKLIDDNDLLLLWDGANAGEFMKGKKGVLSSTMAKLLFHKKITQEFGWYLFVRYEKEIREVTIGMGIPHVNGQDLKNSFVPVPSLAEQHAIVRFLDYKTGQIDSFITNRQKQIELLKEQKAGIINKAVTKGINPNAKMKDSGIDWIGDVPEHWDFKSLRRITKEHRQGYYIDEPYISEGVKLVRITDLHSDGSINYSEMPFVKITKEHEKLYSIEDGDFLFPRTGTIGSLGFVSNPERAVFASYLIRFRFKSNQVLNDYLYYYFMSDAFLDGVFSDLHGGVVQNIHAENIKNQFITHPKEMTEQASIVNYIKSETSIIDSLISKYQKQIDLMQEYRTALISQAVTGKIDVREWEPKKEN